ncbi:MAG: hypothetical protein ACT6TH_02370 [Brevundimonas sp.]|jgi:ElaB/YqjD/DUF883 family membrane-anchored ribosome-binding protein|uniref:hypothetical protein n=1 Tax=Brevundimonas sp. TaxID=1871086 RepID=UPI00403381A3
MTDTRTASAAIEDIIDTDDSVSARLDREAAVILQADEMRSLGVKPVRQAVREDALAVRDWGQARASRLRGAVQDEPIRAALLSLGIGVLIGLLAAR